MQLSLIFIPCEERAADNCTRPLTLIINLFFVETILALHTSNSEAREGSEAHIQRETGRSPEVSLLQRISLK